MDRLKFEVDNWEVMEAWKDGAGGSGCLGAYLGAVPSCFYAFDLYEVSSFFPPCPSSMMLLPYHRVKKPAEHRLEP